MRFTETCVAVAWESEGKRDTVKMEVNKMGDATEGQGPAIPKGFELAEISVKASGHKYAIQALQAKSLDAIRAEYKVQEKDFDAVMLAIWNRGNVTGAKGAGSTPVRLAVEGKDPEKVRKAVEAHQKAAPGFLQGAPRSKGKARHASGLTAKERQELAGVMLIEMSETGETVSIERMKEIAVELGIDPSLVGTKS